MNSFDLMIEKYSKELIETGKKSMASAIKEESNDADYFDAEKGIEEEKLVPAFSVMNESESKSEPTMRSEDNPVNEEQKERKKEEGSGRLKIQTFAADGVYPVVAANVKIYKKGDDIPYFEGYTDSSGIIDDIVLPAPLGIDTDLPPEIEPYSQYDIVITHPKFITKKYKNVPIFENINSIQTVRLVPIEAGTDEEGVIVESENENLMEKDVNIDG